MRWLFYWTVLHTIIQWDYLLREVGLRPDRMHWADRLACSWGYFTT